MSLTLSDALTLLEDFLRSLNDENTRDRSSDYSHYDYDVYLPSLAMNSGIPERSGELSSATAVLADAAWQLVQRGILRPGVKFHRANVYSHAQGMGFSLTQSGRNRLTTQPDLRVDDQDHLQILLGRYGSTFGETFLTLAREAGRTYQAQCSVATCSLAATAAQSLIRTIQAARDQEQLTSPLSFQIATADLKPEAAQRITVLLAPLLRMNEQIVSAEVTRLDQHDAFLALHQLIEATQWLHDHWADLTG